MTAVAPGDDAEVVSSAELVELCAVNTGLFASIFFPRAIRANSPPMHAEWDALLDNPGIRYLNLVAPRGFAKTTKLRIFTAKRIAYRLSRTIMYVGASEDHARRSVMWLQRQIATRAPGTGEWVPTPFSVAYGLKPGAKWNETEIEVLTPEGPVWVLGAGITGNIRGINFDDYRPDLIVIDDALTDENTATPEQRTKINNLVMGSLKESLVPRVEEPNAKLVLLNTPHNPDDLTGTAEKDSTFLTRRYSCWTPETEDLDLEAQESAWPALKPSEELRAEKRGALEANRYSIWAAENECRLVTRERAAFRREWLRFEDEPARMFCVVAVDPVPPPSDVALAKGLFKKDYEAVGVIGRYRGNYYLLDYAKSRGHNPDWTVATAFGFAQQYGAARLVIQGINYERTLKYIFEKEMQRKRQFWPVNTLPTDKRSKYNRIVSTLGGVAAQGRFFIRGSMFDFISQWESYPAIPHEDLLDMTAIGMTDLVNPYLELADDSDYLDDPYAGALSGSDEPVRARRLCP